MADGGVTCPACGHHNAADARFCANCGHRLVPERLREPRAYTPRHLAEKILQQRSVLAGERKHVTVLFADVQGSMDLAEQVDPETWHRILDGFFAILADGVHRFEGTVNQFTGDGIMALFGAPIAHEDHAQRACHAALHLCEALNHYGRELRRTEGLNFSVRMGINTGEVVIGVIGDDLRMDYTAQGHTVGLAQRMEQLAEPGRVYLTEHTAALVSGFFTLEDLGAFTLKGVRDPVRVFELRGVGPLRTRFDAARKRGLSRFVGRDEEAALLETALARAVSADGQVVGVVGEPGVGKSRLCHEFAQRVRARGIPVYEAHGLAHGKNVPFLVLLELTRAYFGITPQDNDQAAREKIAGKLLLLDRTFEDVLPLAFEFLGVPDPERPPPPMDGETRQRALFDVARRIVPSRSRREPAVFVIEDLHWIDGGSEAFVARQVDLAAGMRTLVVLNFRPEYRAPWMDRAHYRPLVLEPLGAAAVAELLQDLLGTDASVAGLADLVRERTGGNPFFVEEVVQALVDGGNLAGRRGTYRLVQPIERMTIPPRVQDVLASRIDRLAEREKDVLQTAAVIGKRVPEPVLRRVVDLGPEALADALRMLADGEFLFEETLHPEIEYVFKHRLTQEVAYYSQLGDRRSRMHAAVARAIVELYPDRLNERAALLAHHWEGAGDLLTAARWGRRAAIWVRSSSLAEAFRHWQTVRDLLARAPESPETMTMAIEASIQLLELGWRLDMPVEQAAKLFEEGEALATRAGARGALAMLVNAYGAVRSHVGDADEFVQSGLQAMRIAEQTDDRGLQLAARTRLVVALVAHGNLEQALTLTEAALAAPPTELALGAPILGYSPQLRLMKERAAVLADLGRLDEAVRELGIAANLARGAGEPEVLGRIEATYVTVARIRGDAETALAHAREAMLIAERLASPFFRAGACLAFGQAHILATRWPEALEALEEALAIARSGHAGIETEGLALTWLAGAHLGRGDAERARARADEGLAAAERRHTRTVECIAHIGRARVMLRTDPVDSRVKIETGLGRALGLVAQTGARSNEPFIRVQLARLALAVGDRQMHRRELRAAYDLFVGMGASLRAAKLKAEIEA